MQAPATPAAAAPGQRLAWIDVLRALALITMASYHFTWDLEFFGYAQPGTANLLPLKIYARAIASTFLFLAGFSLYLSHQNGIRWPNFWQRFAKIAGAALLVTIATFFAMRDEFIFFGVLHEIAAASLIGLLFLRVPSPLTLVLAAAIIALPNVWHSTVFDTPALYWVGLSTALPRSNDYVPVMPWLGPFLIGLAIARILARSGGLRFLSGERLKQNPVIGLASRVSRHSLAIYLVHQPLLIGLVWCATLIAPPASPDPALSYIHSCTAACTADSDGKFCEAFCGCTLSELRTKNLFEMLNKGRIDVKHDERILDISRQCTLSAQGLN